MIGPNGKIAYLLGMPFSGRQKYAMRGRSEVTLEDFMAAFPDEAKEAEEMWKSLRKVSFSEDFCPAPDDDLLAMYGLVDEDLDEIIVDALNNLGYRVPLPSEIVGMEPLRTVRCAVRFLKWCSGEEDK